MSVIQFVIGLESSDVVTALGIDSFVFGHAARKRNAARLRRGTRTVEIFVQIPVVLIDAAAAFEIFLNRINDISQIRIATISFDGVIDVFLDRRREFVAKDEGENGGDDFEKKNDGNGPDEYLEENVVLAQGPQAAAEADDEDESADDQENDRWIGRERFFDVFPTLVELRVETDAEKDAADDPEDEVEGEDRVFDPQTDFGLFFFAFSAHFLCVVRKGVSLEVMRAHAMLSAVL